MSSATIQALVDRYSAEVGKRPTRITLRDTTTRWGSCSPTGRLAFCWRLILAPAEVMDYVVAHEVAHLAELNHGPRFWRLVRRLIPDYDKPRTWLSEHGIRLHRYG
jgi:predicted metal-dependent hydrolase